MIAYELRAEYAGDVEQVLEADPETGAPVRTATVPLFTGGLVNVGERDLDLRRELDENDGRILVAEHDAPALVALDAHPALKRVATDEADEGAAPAGLDDQPVRELRAEADRRGLRIAAGTRKDAIAAGLAEHSRRLDAGDQAVAAGAGRTVTITTAGELLVEEDTVA